MKLRTAFPAIVALAAFTASCSSDSKASRDTTVAPATVPAPATTPSTAPSTAAPDTAVPTSEAAATGDLAMSAAVDIKEFKYGPAETHVAVGGMVTWTNGDNQKHTATASGTFDTGGIEAGQSASATFDTAGTFTYICSFHPFMKGTVVVGS